MYVNFLCQFVGHYSSLYMRLPFDLDCILQKGDILFKSLNNYRYVGMKFVNETVSKNEISGKSSARKII